MGARWPLLLAAALLGLGLVSPHAVGLPPVAIFFVDPVLGPINTSFTFDCAASYDPDGDPITCLWDFGDGGGAVGGRVIHIYAAAGTYLAWLTVGDSTGENATGGLNVTVHLGNRPPVITRLIPGDLDVLIGPGASMGFQVSATDPDGDPLTYRWILDGVSVENDVPFYTYRATTPGSIQSLSVVVSDGQFVTSPSWSITVLNEAGPGPPPTPRPPPPATDYTALVGALVAVIVTLTVLAAVLFVWRPSQRAERPHVPAPSVPWAVWCARCGAPLEPSVATCLACGAPRYRG